MSENKELKKGNGQEPETETAEEGVQLLMSVMLGLQRK